MQKLAQKNKDKVIDLLAERLCFERAGAKLYEKVSRRMRQSSGAKRTDSSRGDYTTYGLSGYKDALRGMREDIGREQGSADAERERQQHDAAVLAKMLPQIEAIRDQEKEHAAWLERCIRDLGGDPKRVTEMARVGAREAAGIESVVMKDPELPHLLHAMLAAEHVDSAGWDLLLALAEEAGDGDAKTEFEKRLREEEHHLAFLREAVRAFSVHEVLDEELKPPPAGGGMPVP